MSSVGFPSTRTRDDAANWAITWRNEIQRYVHAYRAVTGVDLQTGVDATPPTVLLARRERGLARGGPSLRGHRSTQHRRSR
jgi:hypothetical protein